MSMSIVDEFRSLPPGEYEDALRGFAEADALAAKTSGIPISEASRAILDAIPGSLAARKRAADGAVQVTQRFELYRDKTGMFRFRLKAKNGQILAVSDAYADKKSAERAIAALKTGIASSSTADIAV